MTNQPCHEGERLVVEGFHLGGIGRGHAREGRERTERQQLVGRIRLDKAGSTSGVLFARAEVGVGVVGFEGCRKPFADPQRILHRRRLHARVEEQLVNRLVHGGGERHAILGRGDFLPRRFKLSFVGENALVEVGIGAALALRFALALTGPVEFLLHLSEVGVRLGELGAAVEAVEGNAVKTRRVVAADPVVGDAVVLLGEGAILLGALEEDADELVPQRPRLEAEAADENVVLVVCPLQPLRLDSRPIGVGIRKDDVPPGLVHLKPAVQKLTGGTEALAFHGQGVGIPDSQEGPRFVRYLLTRRVPRTSLTEESESGHRARKADALMAKAVHIVAIVACLGAVERAGAPVVEPLPIEPGGKAEPIVMDRKPARATALAPRAMMSRWRDWLPPMPEPVLDGVCVLEGNWVTVVGGFDRSLNAVPYVQIHHPQDGWLPIAAQLREPRARHSVTRLRDGRWLVCGGVAGAVNGELKPVTSCEVIRVGVAGSQDVAPLDAGLMHHTAHALSDGSVAVIGGDAVRIFDPTTLSWTRRAALASPRALHASVLLPGDRLLVIGGDERGTLEEVTIAAERSTTSVWADGLGAGVQECAAAMLPDGRVVIAGGVATTAEGGTTVGCTWIADPASRTLTPGPELPCPQGAARVGAFSVRSGVLLLGGEWRTDSARGEANMAMLLRAEGPTPQIWSVAALPRAVSRSMWASSGDQVFMIGGYRFIGAEESQHTGATMGPWVCAESSQVWVGGGDRIGD